MNYLFPFAVLVLNLLIIRKLTQPPRIYLLEYRPEKKEPPANP
jgi:hypothetical protein